MSEQEGTGWYDNPVLDPVDGVSFTYTNGWHDNPVVDYKGHATNPAVENTEIHSIHQEQQKSFEGHPAADQKDLDQLPNASIFQ